MKNNSTAQIIRQTRASRKMTVREFANALNERMTNPVAFQSISQWENGTRPNFYFFVAVSMKYQDWRQDLAMEILAELRPEDYRDETA